MFLVQLDHWPLIALATSVGTAIVVAVIRYLMLYIGLKKMLGETSQADRPAIYREYARALHAGGPRLGIVIKIIRPQHNRAPVLWVHRDPDGSRRLDSR